MLVWPAACTPYSENSTTGKINDMSEAGRENSDTGVTGRSIRSKRSDMLYDEGTCFVFIGGAICTNGGMFMLYTILNLSK